MTVTATDQSLILGAYEANGYVAQWSEKHDCAMVYKPGWKTQLFVNPLVDAGQAFQLAVEMGMALDVRLCEGTSYAAISEQGLAHGLNHSKFKTPLEATMRLIVELAVKAKAAVPA